MREIVEETKLGISTDATRDQSRRPIALSVCRASPRKTMKTTTAEAR